MEASCMSYDPVAKTIQFPRTPRRPRGSYWGQKRTPRLTLHSRNCRMTNRVTSGYVEEKNLVQLIF